MLRGQEVAGDACEQVVGQGAELGSGAGGAVGADECASRPRLIVPEDNVSSLACTGPGRDACTDPPPY